MNYSAATSGGRNRDKDPKEFNGELSGEPGEDKNWRGIVIALFVIIVICFLVVVAIVIVTPKRTDDKLGDEISLDDIFSDEFKSKHFSASWLPSTERDLLVYRSNVDGNLYEFEPLVNVARLLIDDSVFRTLNVDRYWVSPDANYILLASEVTQIHSYSFDAKYVIYNRHEPDINKRLIRFPQSPAVDNNEWEERKLQYANWSPNGHALTFVYSNNLYYQPSPFMTPVRISDVMGSSFIANGVPDWLYEHEILHSNVAHWVSEDSRLIAYMQINDSNVPLTTITQYGDSSEFYSHNTGVFYPKAGDEHANINPTVKLFVAETANVKASHRLIQPPVKLHHQEHYITSVRWRDRTHLLITWSNRWQNVSVITSCHAMTSSCHQTLLVEPPQELTGWITISQLWPVRSGKYYLTLLDRPVGAKGRFWKHICLVSAEQSNSHRTIASQLFLTDGEHDVSKIVGVSEHANSDTHGDVITVYYLSGDADPRHSHLFRLTHVFGARNATVHETVLSSMCLTCSRANTCRYVDASFSPSTQHYIEICLGPDLPQYSLRSTSSNATDFVFENNTELARELANKSLPIKQNFQLTTDDRNVLLGYILIPPSVNPQHITKYPLIIQAPDWPGTQLVTEKRIDANHWLNYLTTAANVIYAIVDVRGSAGRGRHFEYDVYRRLGQREVSDLIATANYLQKTYRFIDGDKVAIWGLLYGGFLASRVLGDENNNVFKCGIAVSPITDWAYYDTAFAERYLASNTLSDNSRGYDGANISAMTHNFIGREFLLIHGTNDDKVHFQHCTQLMKSLTEAGVLYQTQLYTTAFDFHQDMTSHVTQHMYRTMTHFLLNDCWYHSDQKSKEIDAAAAAAASLREPVADDSHKLKPNKPQ